MIDPKNGWLVMGIQSVVVACVAAMMVMGCASPQVPNGAEAASMVQTVGHVSVVRDGDDSVIRLMGVGDPTYSVSNALDGSTVIVDLVGVEGPNATTLVDPSMGSRDQIASYDGVVDLVTVSTFDEDGMPLTRVEVTLAGPGQAEVTSTSDGLEIRIIPSAKLVETNGAFENVAGRTDDLEADALTRTIATPAANPPAATQLLGMSVNTTDNGVLLGLLADGAVGSVEAFTLENPTRLVIDLPGLAAAGLPATTMVDSKQVVSIRTATHDGKVRVVVDGGPDADSFQGRQIMPGATGLWISIGQGDDLAQRMADEMSASEAIWLATLTPDVAEVPDVPLVAEVVPEVMTEEAVLEEPVTEEKPMLEEVALFDEESLLEEEPAFEAAAPLPIEPDLADVDEAPSAVELAQVYGLHYERTDGLDRTAILTDEAVKYTTSSPDATTFVVMIPGAQISDEASDRIFPKEGGPVALIHAFQQPEVATPEVRVVFTRAPDQKPIMTRRGSMLFVDFQDMGIAAAAPPAFPHAGDTDQAVELAAVETTVKDAPYAMPAVEVAPERVDSNEPGGGSVPAAPANLPPSFDDGALAVVASLPDFDTEETLSKAPTALELTGDVWAAPVAPAAVEVPSAIEVLEEGGLIDGKEYHGRRVSLDFKDVEIADVLRLIAEVSDLNIIAGDEVAGNVTIRLVETPWDQALDVVLMTKGLGFVRVGNVLRIAPSDVLKAEEEVRLQERRNKEKLEDLEVKLLPINYASAKDTEGLVKRLLSSRGTVNLDTRTNTLIIKDISSVIDEASALIAAIDTQTPQVMIEAKIVEASLDFSRELGAVWGLQTNQFRTPFKKGTGLLRDSLGIGDTKFIGSNGLSFANPITSVPTGLASLGALILDKNFRIDAQIQAAESTGNGKVISSPRIVTLDNKKAKIQQGVSIPFQTFEGGDAKLEFIDAVLSLAVTPHITADESIIMKIKVTRNAPDDSVATPTGSPAIAKNQAQTETLVKDGQTLVLGGIYTITKSKRQSRVPYLHRIPIIGNLFKNNEVTDARKELLVFVTPRIVRLPEMAQN